MKNTAPISVLALWVLVYVLLTPAHSLGLTLGSESQFDFLAPRAYFGGNSFDVGDVNGDGVVDVVYGSIGRINVLIGDGKGDFSGLPTSVYVCGSRPLRPLLSDFNGDGTLDIAVYLEDSGCNPNGLGTALMILPGNGDGTFSSALFSNFSHSFFIPNKFAVSDLNGDGRTDVVFGSVGSGTGDKVAVLINNGNGTFSPPVTYFTGSQADTGMLVGDVNQDNRPEIILAGAPSGVIILPNNGDGSFGAAQIVNIGVSYRTGAVGHFNSDAFLDLLMILPGQGSPRFQVLFGAGNGTFSNGPIGTAPVSGVNPVSTIVRDFNNDGVLDFVQSFPMRTLLFQGDGGGSFSHVQTLAVGSGHAFAADFDNDGWIDLGTTHTLGQGFTASGTSTEFAIVRNLNGQFLGSASAEIPFGGAEIAVADFNNDGLIDIALTGDGFESDVFILIQETEFGRGVLEIEPVLVGSGATISPRTIAATDVNGDTFTDIVVAGVPLPGSSANVVVGINDGTGNFTIVESFNVPGTVVKVVSVDVSGDGISDLVFALRRENLPPTSPSLAVALGKGDGSFSPTVGYAPDLSAVSVAVQDFNGDSRPDIAILHTNGNISIFLNNGQGIFSLGTSYNLPLTPTDLESADLDKDGFSDLIVTTNFRSAVNTARVHIFRGVGNGSFSVPTSFPSVGSYDQKLVVGDLDNDGYPDIAVTHNGVLSTFRNNRSGGFSGPRMWASTGALLDIAIANFDSDDSPDLVTTSGASNFFVLNVLFGVDRTAVTGQAPFDFDGDGKTDISIFRPLSWGGAEWWYLRSSDGGSLARAFGAVTDTIVPADFTGDGKTDIAFWRPSTGEWYVIRSEDSTFFAFPFGADGDVPSPADFDGDGVADVAVFRPSNSTWFVQRSSDNQVATTPFGIAGDRPVPADYDGDGKADVAIFRPTGNSGGGEWWYLRSSDGGNRAFAFGTSTDLAVPGDYTGDGKADIAFFRPSTSEWFILRSEDSSFYAFPWGASGDIPAPGDYDGDGKIDAAVFRPSNANWFALQSTAGPLILQFGITGDRPVPNAFVR